MFFNGFRQGISHFIEPFWGYPLHQILHILKRRPLHLLPQIIPDLCEVLTDKLLPLHQTLTRDVNIPHV